LGRIPRRISFPTGQVFETQANDELDTWLHSQGWRSTTGLVDKLERNWKMALTSLMVVVAGSAAFIIWGVPFIADRVADFLPRAVDHSIGQQSLAILDRTAFNPSALPPGRQAVLRQRFEVIAASLPKDFQLHLEFRKGGHIGPNAFALPSGYVVITDELVELVEDDDEIVAVLAHEAGHVAHRHSLKQLLRSAGVAALAFAVLGDVSSVSTLAGAAPALIEAKFSREFEAEADQFSRQWLQQHSINPANFDSMLCRLEQKIGGNGALASFIGSHPSTTERASCPKATPKKAQP
jgi:Zn-dependent protease with chaperone function